jgi:hypothetical protein
MDVILLDPLGNHVGRDVITAPGIAEVAELIMARVQRSAFTVQGNRRTETGDN